MVNGHKHTVFTSAAYEIVSSEMERIVVNQMSNLSTADDDSGVSAQRKCVLTCLIWVGHREWPGWLQFRLWEFAPWDCKLTF